LAVLALGDGFLGKFRGTSPMKIVSTRIMSIEVFFLVIALVFGTPPHMMNPGIGSHFRGRDSQIACEPCSRGWIA
jgi:hypothetical protein